MRLCLVIFALAAVAGACGSDELRLRPVASSVENAAALEATRQALETRVQSLGHVGVKVTLDSAGFVVKMPREKAPPGLLATLAAPGRVTFVRIPPGVKPPEEGSEIDPGLPEILGPEAVQPGTAKLGVNQVGQPSVEFQLTQPAAEVLRRHTRDHIGEFLAIVLDGRAVSVPTIRSEIAEGAVAIEFGAAAPQVDVGSLVAYLASGPLPVAIAPPGE